MRPRATRLPYLSLTLRAGPRTEIYSLQQIWRISLTGDQMSVWIFLATTTFHPLKTGNVLFIIYAKEKSISKVEGKHVKPLN